MNRDEILALAHKAGGKDYQWTNGELSGVLMSPAALQSFAAAIAEHCAAMADEMILYAGCDIANAIRDAFPAPETKP